jgi:Type IV secretion-system coupling protein DNA-binding domain
MAERFYHDPDWLVLGTRKLLTSYTDQEVPWGISHNDRRNHVYCIGKTGMGKTVLLRNLILADIWRGAGVGVIDPHGDLAEDIIDHIPPERSDHVTYFNPADVEYPIAWNLVDSIPVDDRATTADFLVEAFRDIFGDSWGPRLQFILYHALRACLDAQNATLLDSYRLLTDENHRAHIVEQALDPVTRDFWNGEFAGWPAHERLQAVGSIRNKLGRFLGNPAVRNILGQFTGKLDLDFIINNQRIFIANLAKGTLGPDQANLLGSLLVARFQAAAFSRSKIPEEQRLDFNLTIDEFQNFMTDSFASVLSEARKYRLNFTMVHQYLGQAKPAVRDAVFGNAGSLIAFRVGGPDGEVLANVFRSQLMGSTHFLNLNKHEVIASIPDGASAPSPFMGKTLAPMQYPSGRKATIIALVREKYARPRSVVEPRINALFSAAVSGKSPPVTVGVALRKVSPAHHRALEA